MFKYEKYKVMASGTKKRPGASRTLPDPSEPFVHCRHMCWLCFPNITKHPLVLAMLSCVESGTLTAVVHLTVAGPSWNLLDPLGPSRTLLEPPGASWNFLEPPAPSWTLLERPGPFWTGHSVLLVLFA